MAKKRSLLIVNEHFEPLSNAAMSSAVVFKQPVMAVSVATGSGAYNGALKPDNQEEKIIEHS
jgi:hypothetical protein